MSNETEQTMCVWQVTYKGILSCLKDTNVKDLQDFSKTELNFLAKKGMNSSYTSPRSS